MLKMKKMCEKCSNLTPLDGVAYVCSFECTFCEDCTNEMAHVCPNCSGELVARPKRTKKPLEVAASQLKSKLFGR